MLTYSYLIKRYEEIAETMKNKLSTYLAKGWKSCVYFQFPPICIEKFGIKNPKFLNPCMPSSKYGGDTGK